MSSGLPDGGYAALHLRWGPDRIFAHVVLYIGVRRLIDRPYGPFLRRLGATAIKQGP
jgi:hypothetical protein